MKIWLSKNSSISIREQLTRQIILAIISGDLEKGSRLPSVRELAQRCGIHSNTASAAYRRLAEDGWVEARAGSGVFVRDVPQKQVAEASRSIEADLDKLIQSFLKEAARRGFSRKQIKTRLYVRLNAKPPKNIIIVEENHELSRILADELSEKFSLPISVAENQANIAAKHSVIVSLAEPDEEFSAPPIFVKLKFNSVQNSMRGQTKPRETDLIAIASNWEIFRLRAQTMLIAAGICEENLVIRDANEADWQNGLKSCRFIVADNLTAKSCRNFLDVKTFRLISDDSIDEIRNLLV
ncbi:MAG: GntR family transcriptional regulator [Pyrinomonadaceae bacterium]